VMLETYRGVINKDIKKCLNLVISKEMLWIAGWLFGWLVGWLINV